MNNSLPHHLQPLIETLCEAGCRNVNQIIETLESGGHVEGTAVLTDEERMQVLNELRTIMSVYDQGD